MAIADVKRRVEKGDSDAPRKMPQPERTERHRRQRDRLKGLQLTGPLECSDSLIDKAVAIYDNNELTYLSWDMLTSKDDEEKSIKHIKELKADSEGYVKEFHRTKADSADTSSDLLLKFALTGRGLAMDQAEVLTFESHKKIINLLIGEMMRPALPGYSKVKVEQLLRADQQIFKMLREVTRDDGVQSIGGRVKPLDEQVDEVIKSSAVTLLLAPLRGGSHGGGKRDRAASSSSGHGGKAKNRRDKRQRQKEAKKKLVAENEMLKAQSQGKGKAKGKDRGGGKEAPLPRELIGMSPTSTDNRSLCYGYNMKAGCSDKVEPGGRCRRGYHLCMVPGCSKQHPAYKHSE